MGNILNPVKDNSFIGLVKAKDSRVFVDVNVIIKMSKKKHLKNA